MIKYPIESEVFYLKANSNYTEINTKENSIMVAYSMSFVIKNKYKNFVRVNHQIAVNPQFIENKTKNTVLVNNQLFNISRRKQK